MKHVLHHVAWNMLAVCMPAMVARQDFFTEQRV